MNIDNKGAVIIVLCLIIVAIAFAPVVPVETCIRVSGVKVSCWNNYISLFQLMEEMNGGHLKIVPTSYY